MGQREGGRKEGIDALFVMLWNQGMSFQSRLGSMKELMARAAPCMRSTLPSCLFAVTSAGSSASNFCRMSYSRHRCQSTRSIPGNRIFKGYEEIRGQTDLLTTAELGGVDGDEERLNAALLGVLHELLRDFAVLVHVPTATVRTYVQQDNCGFGLTVGGTALGPVEQHQPARRMHTRRGLGSIYALISTHIPG